MAFFTRQWKCAIVLLKFFSRVYCTTHLKHCVQLRRRGCVLAMTSDSDVLLIRHSEMWFLLPILDKFSPFLEFEEDTADSHNESVDEASIAGDRGERGGAVGAHLEDEKEEDEKEEAEKEEDAEEENEEEGDELDVMKDEVEVSLSQLNLLLPCLGCGRRGSV